MAQNLFLDKTAPPTTPTAKRRPPRTSPSASKASPTATSTGPRGCASWPSRSTPRRGRRRGAPRLFEGLHRDAGAKLKGTRRVGNSSSTPAPHLSRFVARLFSSSSDSASAWPRPPSRKTRLPVQALRTAPRRQSFPGREGRGAGRGRGDEALERRRQAAFAGAPGKTRAGRRAHDRAPARMGEELPEEGRAARGRLVGGARAGDRGRALARRRL